MQFNIMHLLTHLINMLSKNNWEQVLTGYTVVIAAVSKTLEAIKLYKDLKSSR